MDMSMAIGMTTGLAFSMLCCTLIVCTKLNAILRRLDLDATIRRLEKAERPGDEGAERGPEKRRRG